MKAIKFLFRTILILLIIAVLTIGGYISYLQINYYRIDDGVELPVSNQRAENIEVGKDYTVMTYNIGFGAYDHEFSFFMDKGRMNDGSEVSGTYGKARSKESVETNTHGAKAHIEKHSPDFCILQEVDTASTRSFFINQRNIIESAFDDYCSVYGENFHSSYLCYPINDPHGSVRAGLLTLSRYKIANAVRRSYPVDESFITKFFDLDRCFVITRIPTNTGKKLVLINSHMSAYDEGGLIRQQQLELLRNVLTEEYDKGNYVIAGGDFNKDLSGNAEKFFNTSAGDYTWAQPIPEETFAGYNVSLVFPYDEETEEGDPHLTMSYDQEENSYTWQYQFVNLHADHTVHFVFGELVSIDPVASNVTMKLQPNPATSQVSLNIEGVNGMVNCSIIDMSGRVVYNQSINAENANVINLNSLAKGAYFVRITNDQFSKVEKLIVR